MTKTKLCVLVDGPSLVVLCRPAQVTYVVWIELTVSGQTVQKSLDVWSEDVVKSCIIYFIQMFSEAVPEVKGDLHNLDRTKDQKTGKPGKRIIIKNLSRSN